LNGYPGVQKKITPKGSRRQSQKDRNRREKGGRDRAFWQFTLQNRVRGRQGVEMTDLAQQKGSNAKPIRWKSGTVKKR